MTLAALKRWCKKSPPAVNALDYYVTSAPSNQNAVDIFKGEWSSKFPESADVKAGNAELFTDGRVTFLNECLPGGLKGKKVLELGPLEGGHTYAMEKLGAASVLAIEANTHAFLRCLVAKETLGMKSHFMLGDFNRYLEETKDTFDVCLASGVLYHQKEPVKMLSHIAKRSKHVLVWSHYYDEKIIHKEGSHLGDYFEKQPIVQKFEGAEYKLYLKKYKEAVSWGGFCGGTGADAYWMTRVDMKKALSKQGYKHFAESFDHPDHPNGPAIAIYASKEVNE
ncbi:MAG: DUF1698 domain-containing protein [Proteobacteria bacterium]|nr:DUF1698 domain-containing protein [Pseudomonadota bacterium]